jgi:hypothetical protein
MEVMSNTRGCRRRGEPTRKTRPTPPPNGTVHVSLLMFFQFAVMIGELVRYQPLGRL